MRDNFFIHKVLLVLGVLLLSACIEIKHDSYIVGSITSRQAEVMPLGARMEISLVDVSIADATSKMIARSILTKDVQLPTTFQLHYDAKEIEQNRTYAVQVRIYDGTTLLFINDVSHQVLTRGRDNRVNMELKKIN
ncbi:MAG: YbaY family lipoprotein [Betaproteobacteria bacterium]